MDTNMKKIMTNDVVCRNSKPNYFQENYGYPYKEMIDLGQGFKVFSQTLFIADSEADLSSMLHVIELDDDLAIGDDQVEPLDYYDQIDVYKVYSDGGSVNNGKKNPDKDSYGAYGMIVLKNDKEIYRDSYIEKDWTNNIAEISGAINGLEFVKGNMDPKKLNIVVLISDSQYVINGMTEWRRGWEQRGWKNNAGKPVANMTYWKRLISLCDSMNMYYKWVRGHTLKSEQDSLYNEKCDILAGKLLKEHR